MCGLQKLYGNAESLQAFSVSFLLSFLYPLVFFLLSYSYFDGANVFSSMALLSADSSFRPLLLPVILLLSFVMFSSLKFFINHIHCADKWGMAQLHQLGLPLNMADQIWRAIRSLLLAFISVFWFTGAMGIVLYFFGGFTYWLAVVCIAVVIMSTFTLDSSLSVVIVSVVVVCVALAISAAFISPWSSYNTSLMFAFFYLALPLVNALLDWLSWWVSRFFLERTAQESRVRVIVLDVVLDFGVAVLFMLALCLLLPAGAMVLDSLYAGWVDVKSGVPAQTGWQEYAVWARDDPWGKGIMVTLMLVTTLIPTLLHILLGLMAFFIHGFKGAALADFLEQPRRNWRDGIASLWMFGYGVLAVATLLAMYHVFQHFAQLSIAQWLYDFTGYFYDLP